MRFIFNPMYDSIKEDVEILAVHSRLDMNGLKTLLKNDTFKFPILDDNTGGAINKGYYTTKYPANYMVDKWGYLYKSGETTTNADELIKYNVGTILSESAMRTIIDGAIRRGNV